MLQVQAAPAQIPGQALPLLHGRTPCLLQGATDPQELTTGEENCPEFVVFLLLFEHKTLGHSPMFAAKSKHSLVQCQAHCTHRGQRAEPGVCPWPQKS